MTPPISQQHSCSADIIAFYIYSMDNSFVEHAANGYYRQFLYLVSTQEGETAIFFAARNGHADIIKLLAENGAVVDHKNKVDILSS